jgi:hypothetical protein
MKIEQYYGQLLSSAVTTALKKDFILELVEVERVRTIQMETKSKFNKEECRK